MKCQHCGSTDIILIQGQNYCLTCGYAVTEEKPAPSAIRSKAVAAAAGSVSPARRTQSHPKKDALNRLGQVHPWRFSVVLAAGVAIVSAGVAMLALWLHFDTDTAVYLLAVVLVASGVLISLGHLALLYGSSRSQDRRPAPHDYWWLAARSGYLEVINVQLMALIEAIIIIGVGAVAWKIAVATGLSLYGSAVVLGVINVILAWLLVGVYGAARLATPAVIVGGMNALDASRVGWRLYRQAGGHLVGVGIEAVLTRIVALGVVAGVLYATITRLDTSNQLAVIIGSAVGLTVLVFAASLIVLRVDTGLWLGQYRRLAMVCPPPERLRLLTGRVQRSVKP